ncbi:MAG TPA: hypothetical protein PL188_11015 [Candidatus Cloacimonadota bacterium]|nr:hypothetical protein [Candidatus Cloacimonadota bacterium]
MFTFIILAYAILITVLFLCTYVGASADRQAFSIRNHHNRLVCKELTRQLREARSALQSVRLDCQNLKQVIARQDKDITTCHKLMELQDQATELSTLNSQLSTPTEVKSAQG